MNTDVQFTESNRGFASNFGESSQSFRAEYSGGGSAGQGKDGASAYEIALKNGFVGSEVEWLESLHGKDGTDGQPGKDGANGKDGADGKTPVKGTDYFTEADKAELVSAVIAALPVYNGEVVSV